MWVTRGPFGSDELQRACVTSVTWPLSLTRSSVELRPQTTLMHGNTNGKGQRTFGRIVETTQGRPGDLEGTPSPAPQGLLTGVWGSQGPSGRSATRGIPLLIDYMTTDSDQRQRAPQE